MSGKSVYTCAYCGSEVEKYPSKVTGDNIFCDKDCYGAYKSENISGDDLPWYEGEKHVEECDYCGEKVTVYGSLRREQEHNFCDHDCYGKFERTESDRPYYGPKWAKQRRTALEESDGVCIYEGCEREESRNGRELDLHHIIPVRKFETFEEANKPSNLVPVCASHHGKIEGKPPEFFNE
jgi:hypothetical protein